MSRRAIAGTVVAALIATAIGIVLSYVIHWFPAQASTQAHNTDRLYHVLVIASVPIFVLVVTVILFSVWHFRMKPGQELQDGPPIHGNTRLEVFWTAIPAMILLSLVSYSFVVLHDNEKKPAGPEMLYVPENESVYFAIHSKDVIHAFWIPAFRLQIDAVPGITTHYRATPDRLGSYPVVCNLLCGVGHSLMRSTIHVVTPEQFQAWLKRQTSAPASAS
jgi:cytochrome c oxidase subunit 2